MGEGHIGSNGPQAPGALVRSVGRWPLLFTGLGAMIGSGWLFGAARAAALAGPASVFAWVIGSIIALSIAALATELGAMFPVAGGMVRYAQVTHGRPLGFLTACANWIAITSVIPIEAEASVQYMSAWPYPWAHALYRNGTLTPEALVIAGALVVVYFLVNYWGMRIFARVNAAVTVFKLFVPCATALTLLAVALHAGVHPMGPFLPYGASGVLTAVATSGIVFAYNGFQSPLNLAGEVRDPGRSVPFATLGSVGVATIVYLLLQAAFLVAAHPGAGGWASLDLASPFADLALSFQLNGIVALLYLDAFVSPSGTGATDMATSARLTLGMQRNGTAPAVFGRTHPLYHAPRPALWLSLIVSFVLLYFFRGWSILAGAISVSVVISYLMIPVCAVALRRRLPSHPRPWRLRGIAVIGPLSFVFASWLLYWACWPLSAEVILLVLACVPLYLWVRAKDPWRVHRDAVRTALWFPAYLISIAVLSFAGSPQFGGRGWIAYPWDLAAVAAVALVFFRWGVAASLSNPDLECLIEPEV
jgi:amino acid transporter